MAQGTVPEGEIAQMVTFSHCLCAQIIILVCNFHPNDKNKRGLFLFSSFFCPEECTKLYEDSAKYDKLGNVVNFYCRCSN